MTEADAGLQEVPTNDPTTSLIELLDLGELEGARTDEDIFMGPSQRQPHQRVFGGQVLAQSLIAGMRTVEDDRTVHSMHGYFLRPGDATSPSPSGCSGCGTAARSRRAGSMRTRRESRSCP